MLSYLFVFWEAVSLLVLFIPFFQCLITVLCCCNATYHFLNVMTVCRQYKAAVELVKVIKPAAVFSGVYIQRLKKKTDPVLHVLITAKSLKRLPVERSLTHPCVCMCFHSPMPEEARHICLFFLNSHLTNSQSRDLTLRHYEGVRNTTSEQLSWWDVHQNRRQFCL